MKATVAESTQNEALHYPSTVLVVDDEPRTLEMMERVLRQRGTPMRVASSGDEAITILESESMSGLVVDKNMPGISGIEVIRRAKELHPYCACIVMTAYPTTESAVQALQLGAVDYVSKPIVSMEVFVQKLEQHVEFARLQYERAALLEDLQHARHEVVDKTQENERLSFEISILRRLLEREIPMP